MSEEMIPDLINDLTACATFEEAAARTTSALAETLDAALEGSPYDRAQVLQGVVHLRPADGYRHLAVVKLREHGAPASDARAEAAPSLTSATAWRWVSTSGGPVAIDVTMGTVEAAGRTHAWALRAADGAQVDGQKSKLGWLERRVTHVLVFALRAPGGAIDGMIALEVKCNGAIGKGFAWAAACRDQLALLASVAAPYLLALPARPPGVPAGDPHLPVVGASMRPVVAMLRIFAEQDETLLLSGPTGAGKSRLARWCHERGDRSARPFETLELASVPDNLQMAHLFGWKRGAFTDAVRDTPGAVARAEGGTLFIDEIDKLSIGAQAGLLRVLEERLYRPLGDSAEERPADVRFIVGTNVDLQQAVAEGRFREDLYYRINVLPVRLPPLRERADEVAAWAEYMLERRRGAGQPARITGAALRALEAYPWPGNLRQLDNIVRRLYALALLGAADRPPSAELRIDETHVAQALTLESGAIAGGHSLVGLMALTAQAFVAEAERKQARGEALDLDLADALRGYVLTAAAKKHNGLEAAFRLLGKEAIVAHRNHKRVYGKELERVEALRASVGGGSPLETKE